MLTRFDILGCHPDWHAILSDLGAFGDRFGRKFMPHLDILNKRHTIGVIAHRQLGQCNGNVVRGMQR